MIIMREKQKIFAFIFLMTYLSFLCHDLFAHHHHEMPSTHSSEFVCHATNTKAESDHDHLHEACCQNHLESNCLSCENDQQLHNNFILFKVLNIDLVRVLTPNELFQNISIERKLPIHDILHFGCSDVIYSGNGLRAPPQSS